MQTLLRSTHAYKLLKTDGERGAFSHAYLLLFDDPRNLRTAVKTFAKLFFDDERAKNLVESETFSDCLFFPDPDKKFVVEDAERVAEECTLKPVEGDKKVFVIADFAEATPAAQNKLLKLLEEPPKGVVFLLGASTSYPVLPTVLSRVKRLEIPPFDVKQVADCLSRMYGNAEGDGFSLCAAASGGSVGAAQNMLEGGAYKSLVDDAFSLLLVSSDGVPALVKRVGETKRKKELLSLLRLIFRDALVLKSNADDRHIFLRSQTARLSRVAEKYPLPALVKAQDFLSAAERQLAFNAVFPQCLEVLLGNISEVV